MIAAARRKCLTNSNPFCIHIVNLLVWLGCGIFDWSECNVSVHSDEILYIIVRGPQRHPSTILCFFFPIWSFCIERFVVPCFFLYVPSICVVTVSKGGLSRPYICVWIVQTMCSHWNKPSIFTRKAPSGKRPCGSKKSSVRGEFFIPWYKGRSIILVVKEKEFIWEVKKK
jgi:hypothetical protein